MELTRLVAVLATLVVVFAGTGATLTLVAGPLTGGFALAAVVVTVLVVAAVGAAARLGSRGPEWLDSGGYW
jgi:amino acid transporter